MANLPKNPPVTNRAGAEKNKAANAIHMQDQFKAGSQPMDTSAISKLGAAFTGEQRQQDVAATGAEASKAVAGVEREQQVNEIAQDSRNIKDQDQLDQSIMEKKNKLLAMNLEFKDEEFDTALEIEKLGQTQDFNNEMQISDLALESFADKNEYAEMLILSNQKIKQQAADDQWELDVYLEAEKDGVISRAIAADAALAQKFALAKAEAQRKARESRRKAASSNRTTGALTAAAGVAVSFISPAIGGPMIVQGAQTYAAAESQPEDDPALA